MPKHSYVSAERFILSREFFGMKLGLENITGFLASIGSPQNNYPTIHISGTNGKGSTAAMIASILQEQGYKTGLFTSPHLVTLRERIRVNGRKIPKPSVVAFIDRYRKILQERKLSFFEVITALGLYYFDKVRVDVAVIETGLGGRLDATNVLKPLITITTDISRDHVEILGSGLRKIAREKAGIMKPGVPHLVGMIPETTRDVFRKRSEQINSPLYLLSPEEFIAIPNRNRLDFIANGWTVTGLQPGLYGAHQLKNAALVVKAVSLAHARNLRISKRAIRNGLKKTRWLGRFQVIERKRLPTLVFDVCHNTGGVQAFVNAFTTRFPGRKAHIITGFVKRKEHQKMFDLLGQVAEKFYLVPLATHRTTNIDELCTTINWRNVPYSKYPSLQKAYERVRKTSHRDDIIAIIGSHFLVGEFFERFGLV